MDFSLNNISLPCPLLTLPEFVPFVMFHKFRGLLCDINKIFAQLNNPRGFCVYFMWDGPGSLGCSEGRRLARKTPKQVNWWRFSPIIWKTTYWHTGHFHQNDIYPQIYFLKGPNPRFTFHTDASTVALLTLFSVWRLRIIWFNEIWGIWPKFENPSHRDEGKGRLPIGWTK